MNDRIPYWYESAAGTASASPGSAGVVAEWPVGPVCSVVAGQTESCSRVGVWLFWDDWRAGPSWPGGTGGVTTWRFGLEKEQEGRIKGHVQVLGSEFVRGDPTGGKHLLLPHLLLLEEVLQERLVTWAHFGIEARLKRHRAQQLSRQPVLDVCRSVIQRHGSLRGQTNTIATAIQKWTICNRTRTEVLCQSE